MHIKDEDYAIEPFGHIEIDPMMKSNRQGSFNFSGGTVLITTYADSLSNHYVSLSYYTGGRGYYRTIIRRKPYTDLGLKRVAGRFGREIHSRTIK